LGGVGCNCLGVRGDRRPGGARVGCWWGGVWVLGLTFLACAVLAQGSVWVLFSWAWLGSGAGVASWVVGEGGDRCVRVEGGWVGGGLLLRAYGRGGRRV